MNLVIPTWNASGPTRPSKNGTNLLIQESLTSASMLPLEFGAFVQVEGQTQSGIMLVLQSLHTNVLISLGCQIYTIKMEMEELEALNY